MNLTEKNCVSCEGAAKPLRGSVLAKRMKEIPHWSRSGEKIRRELAFDDFKEALAFVNKIGALAEAEGHHPDIHLVSYKKVIIELSTHSIKGLSENDFILASKIDSLL